MPSVVISKHQPGGIFVEIKVTNATTYTTKLEESALRIFNIYKPPMIIELTINQI
jgi:hypothetical protein